MELKISPVAKTLIRTRGLVSLIVEAIPIVASLRRAVYNATRFCFLSLSLPSHLLYLTLPTSATKLKYEKVEKVEKVEMVEKVEKERERELKVEYNANTELWDDGRKRANYDGTFWIIT